MPRYKFQISNFKFQSNQALEIGHWRLDIPRSGGEGFTLIEILVAISIVSIVFGLILTSASAISKNSRDVQRKADLKNIQSALQQYYADQNFFPNNNFVLTSAGSLTSRKGNPAPILPDKTYLSNIPKDPAPGTTIPYIYNAFISSASDLSNPDCDNSPDKECHYYCLLAKLENPSTGSGVCGPPRTNYNWIVTAN